MPQYFNSLIASIKNNHVLVEQSFHNVLRDEDLKHYPPELAILSIRKKHFQKGSIQLLLD